MSRPSLRVLVDGAPLPEAEGRAFWQRFSEWMEAKKGDLAGFAVAEGFASVHPEMHDGAPVLVASRSTPQRAYANAPSKGGAAPSQGGAGARPNARAGGSAGHQAGRSDGKKPHRGGGKSH